MFKIERQGNNFYASYNFTLDELYWLLDLIPPNDTFYRNEIQSAIDQLEQLGEIKFTPKKETNAKI